MKKLLILGLLVVVLAACAKGPDQTKTEGKPTASASEIIPQEIFANEAEVKLTYIGLEEFSGFWGYVFKTENNNDFIVHVKTKDVFVNGKVSWSTTQVNIHPHDTLEMVQSIFMEDLEAKGLTDKVDFIELKIAVHNYDTMELLYETPVLRIMYNPD